HPQRPGPHHVTRFHRRGEVAAEPVFEFSHRQHHRVSWAARGGRGGVMAGKAWHHEWMRARALLGSTATVGAAVVGYASVVERNWFALRRYDVPVLRPGARPLRLLHISDVHLTPGRHRLLSWIRSLDALQPDLVVNTGDSIAHPEAVEPFLEALGP